MIDRNPSVEISVPDPAVGMTKFTISIPMEPDRRSQPDSIDLEGKRVAILSTDKLRLEETKQALEFHSLKTKAFNTKTALMDDNAENSKQWHTVLVDAFQTGNECRSRRERAVGT